MFFRPSKSRQGQKILEPSGVEVQLNIQIKIKIPKSQSESYSIPKTHKSRLKGHEFSLHLQNRDKNQYFGQVCIIDLCPYPNFNQHVKT